MFWLLRLAYRLAAWLDHDSVLTNAAMVVNTRRGNF